MHTAVETRVSATLLAGLVIAVMVFAGEPVWQVKDDVYYAMLADGYGLVQHPATELPYMHPLVGKAVSGIQAAGTRFAYAIYLYLCLWMGGIAIAFRFLKSRGCVAAILCLVVGLAPVALLPQYTTVAGFLVASTAVLWTTGTAGQPTIAEWSYGFLLILVASLFRVEMVAVAAVCLSPVVLADAYASRWLNRSLLAKLVLGSSIVGAAYFVTKVGIGDPRMIEFYRYNDPIAVLLNYRYDAALDYLGMPLLQGFSVNDLGLLRSWFFAYKPIIEPATLTGLIDQVPFLEVVRQRYWEAYSDLVRLPKTVYLWFTLAAIVLSTLSRVPNASLAGIAMFALAWAASALLGKPFPERVAMGISLGLFLMAALTTRQDQRSRWRAVWTYVFAAGLLLPVGWNIVADRIDLERRASQLEKDFPLLRGKDVIYSSMGELPLRAGFRPFSALENVPPLVFMGSMYLLPQVVEGERLRGCGGFVDCLASGTTLNLVASDDDVKRLDTLLREHYGKTLTTLTRTSTPSFTLHVIAAKDS